jgi:hypothetical protein
MTSRKWMFIHESILTKCPLYVSPDFSSTICSRGTRQVEVRCCGCRGPADLSNHSPQGAPVLSVAAIRAAWSAEPLRAPTACLAASFLCCCCPAC